MTDQTLELLIKRFDHLTAEFNELREGVMKAVRISSDDPEMALTRARKVLEYVVRDVYRLRCKEDPGTRPLENLLQRLVKDGHLPKRLGAYASYIRDLGNVGTHVYGEDLTKDDVRRSFENLTAILEWYFEQVRPDAFMKPGDAAFEEVETRRFAEEEIRRKAEESERMRRAAEEQRPVAPMEAERVKVQETAHTVPSEVSESVKQPVERQQEKKQVDARKPSPAAARVFGVFGIVCVLGGVLGFLTGSGVRAWVFAFLGLLLIVISVRMRRFGAHEQAQTPAAPEHRSPKFKALNSTLGKIIVGAILGLVAGAVAAPILDFYKAEPILGALLVGVLHGLVIGLILLPIGRVMNSRVLTSLFGIFIGAIVGVIIRAIIASMFGNIYWYMSASDGTAVEILGGGILGLILGAVHGSKRRAQ